MEADKYIVYRYFEGVSEDRFRGTKDECQAYIDSRGDSGKASYTIEVDVTTLD